MVSEFVQHPGLTYSTSETCKKLQRNTIDTFSKMFSGILVYVTLRSNAQAVMKS